MPVYEYRCPTCEITVDIMHPIAGPTPSTETPGGVDTIAEDNTYAFRHECGELLAKLISVPHVKTIVRGNQDYAQRERERLVKRSDDHWNKKGHREATERVVAQGHSHKAVPKKNPNG